MTPAWRSSRVWRNTALIWAGIIFAYCAVRVTWRPANVTIPQMLTGTFFTYVCWALLTPFLFEFASRHPISSERRTLTVRRNVLFLLVVPFVYEIPAIGLSFVYHWIFGGDGPWIVRDGLKGFASEYVFDLVNAAEVLAISHGLVTWRIGRDRELNAVQLEAELAKARLKLLELRLHPHFLFNTLNAIASLVHKDSDAAERMIAMLGDLLRHALSGDAAEEVPLREEIVFVERYVAIEQVRFGERLAVAFKIGDDCQEAQVPTFLLQPLVENAVRHGVARVDGQCHVTISARTENSHLSIAVEDDGPGPNGRSSNGFGLGLATTRERLSQMYGAAGVLALEPRAEGGTRVRLELPFRRSE